MLSTGACIFLVICVVCAIVGIGLVIGGSHYNEYEDYQDREREAAYWRERNNPK